MTDRASGNSASVVASARPSTGGSEPDELAGYCEPFSSISGADLTGLVDRTASARVVLLGESTWGTSEFHQLCARITRALVTTSGCRTIVIDADWPDVAVLDAWCARRRPDRATVPFTAFPAWRWRNQEFGTLLSWVRGWNSEHPASDAVRLVGLDVDAGDVLRARALAALDERDPVVADAARRRYAAAVPWIHPTGPAPSTRSPASSLVPDVVDDAIAAAVDRLGSATGAAARLDPGARRALMDATEASVTGIVDAGPDWWSVRERRSTELLGALVAAADGPVLVWSHSSRVGDASATDLDLAGAASLGQACRNEWGTAAHLIGFGTGSGSVAAASSWGGHTEVLRLGRSRPGSVEEMFTSTHFPACLVDLRSAVRSVAAGGTDARCGNSGTRPQRVLGPVVPSGPGQRPDELQADLAGQFDEFVWIGETSAVVPVPVRSVIRRDRFPGGRSAR